MIKAYYLNVKFLELWVKIYNKIEGQGLLAIFYKCNWKLAYKLCKYIS